MKNPKLKTINYLIPVELWAAVKIKAINDGLSLKNAVIVAFTDYIKKVKK
jgi:hypothetical protein